LNCPNCKQEIKDSNICPSCGIDVVLFEKTLKISDVLYNKGLNLAKVRDLSGASDALMKSIQFNKNNYYARNLLGLVFYETGHIGDALKQWVISASLMSEMNPAVKYIERVQKSPKDMDMLDDAIEMYNNALGYIDQKSDDIAIIQLKKAIELSPKFIDAMNLLAFCYLIQNEKQKASQLIIKVLELDINNPIALNYYNEVFPNRQRPKPSEKKEPKKVSPVTSTAMLTPESRKKLFGNNFYFAEFVSFFAGCICVLALMYILVIPGATEERDNKITQLEDKITSMEEAQKTKETELNDKITALTEENTKVKEENAHLNSEVTVQRKVSTLNSALELYSNGETGEAASVIYSIDPTGLDEENMTKYENAKEEIYKKAASTYYDQGVSSFNKAEYEDARRSFESCIIYAAEDANFIDDAAYFLGRIAEEDKDLEKAKLYYNMVLEKYPNSNRTSATKNRMNAMEG
jgi:tetratricopeptide (TPR) repeat protein